ncbi:uncharacterized protein SCHCODRAFT_02630381 [Schizophyllum commune H4-8]|uniref:uncharacterized protein n=1 Tax=Schizophyllum commune (strain H4-8 / FGSC 9210) TaxID=578458 RepID=UPI002160A1F9|nr:uncharacterized protein SCHCODRAFT_02630381 [Schizophyllum commune H4-8]KAI5889910.1 hypothetical protein SCHCODRAFT_02630381 [Schizophyllum commune H4-8]
MDVSCLARTSSLLLSHRRSPSAASLLLSIHHATPPSPSPPPSTRHPQVALSLVDTLHVPPSLRALAVTIVPRSGGRHRSALWRSPSFCALEVVTVLCSRHRSCTATATVAAWGARQSR